MTAPAARRAVAPGLVLLLSVACGIAIAWVDSRPGWDDTGMTATSLLVAAAVCAVIAPRRAWLWALGVGIWLPVHAIATGSHWDMLVTLAFPLAGAAAGFAIRKAGDAALGAG